MGTSCFQKALPLLSCLTSKLPVSPAGCRPWGPVRTHHNGRLVRVTIASPLGHSNSRPTSLTASTFALLNGKLWWWDKSCPSLVSLNGFVGTEPHPSRLDVCGWLCPTAADLSRCNTDHMASKAENTYYLAFLQKRLAYLYSVLLRKEYHFIEKERERK